MTGDGADGAGDGLEMEVGNWILWWVIEFMDIGSLGGEGGAQSFSMEIRFVSWMGSGDEKGLFYITL